MRALNIIKDLKVLLYSVYFNFRYLPMKQAFRLPILVYKLNYMGGGKILIDNAVISRGMIRLGYYRAATYPDTGLSLINEGKIVFKGKCVIGNNCSVLVEKNASVVFGEDFKVNAAMKLESHSYVVFGSHVLIGWEVVINDLYCESPEQQGIEIGDNNWLSTRCLVLGAVKTPRNCVFGAYSFIRHHDCSILQPNCLFGNEPLCLLKQNVMRNYHHDLITDYTLPQY